MDPTHPELSVPTRIGRYVDLRVLGRGGMGAVYRAHDPELDRAVAIKVMLHSTPEFQERFRREAQSIARLTHGNVVQVFDFGLDDELNPYFVMELVDGTPLDKILAQRGRLPADEATGFARQAALGLAAAHRAGIIHRDVKPSNLIVDLQGTVKLVDFGIARATASAQLTTAASLMGTPGYMSPEQAQGKPVDHRADIYALGLTLFEMLAGQPPFYAEDPIALVVMNMQEPLPNLRQRNLGLSEDLIALVEKMAQKSPDNRVQSCDEVVRAIDALGAPRMPSAHHAVSIPPTNLGPLPQELASPPPAARGRGVALAIGVALAVSGVGVGALLLSRKPNDKPAIVEPARQDPQPKIAQADPTTTPKQGATQPNTEVAAPRVDATVPTGTTQLAMRPETKDGPLRVAVLKFANLSRDPKLDSLAGGIGETAIDQMVGVAKGRLSIIERADIDSDIAELDRGKDEHFDKATVAPIGNLEGIDIAVQGAYQRVGRALRINARFVRVKTGEVLDVVHYDGHAREVFDMQDEIAKQLHAHLVTLVDRERPTVEPQAKGP